MTLSTPTTEIHILETTLTTHTWVKQVSTCSLELFILLFSCFFYTLFPTIMGTFILE